MVSDDWGRVITMNNNFVRLRYMLADYVAGKPLDRPERLKQLADRICQDLQHKRIVDIDAWAQQLAVDVGHLTD